MSHWGDTEKRLKDFLHLKAATLAIHGAQHPDPLTGAVMPPIYQTSTYAQRAPGEPFGEFEYSRTHNPTRRVLEDCLALLEGGTYGMATSSGMSAITLILSLLKAGDEILCCDDVYGGTYRILTKVMGALGIKCRFQDMVGKDLELRPETKMLWIETPTNPLLKVLNIEKLTTQARDHGALSVVDNTFMSPIFQNPLRLGADMVVHSLTKYVGGHSDTVAGAVITSDLSLAEKLYFNQNSMGLVCPPFDSWLLLRSIKTLPVRMKAHAKQALELAKFLSNHPKVEKVIYPGLESHPQHELAQKQMSGFGGMLSFYMKGNLTQSQKFLSSLKVFTLAESLGGVESLIEHPGIMTHASLPASYRKEIGIGDNFIRVSVGLEDIEDLKKDLDAAL